MAARNALSACDAVDCMLLLRGLAAVAGEDAAQAGARGSADAEQQGRQAVAHLAQAQGQGPDAGQGQGQEASPLLPLLPEERELLVAVLRRYTVG